MIPLARPTLDVTDVPVGREMLRVLPAPRVQVFPKVRFVLVPTWIMEIVFWPPFAESVRLPSVWLATAAVLPLAIKVAPPRVRADAELIRLVGVARLIISTVKVPPLTIVGPV